jgi:hypothetical protein
VLDAEKNIGSDAGDKTFATLINNAQAFYTSRKTGGPTAYRGAVRHDEVAAGDSAKLQVQLLTLKGNTDAADAAQFAIDTAGMSPDEIEQFKANQALQQQIDDVTAATRRAVDVAKEHAQLQDQLNQLTLTSDQLLAAAARHARREQPGAFRRDPAGQGAAGGRCSRGGKPGRGDRRRKRPAGPAESVDDDQHAAARLAARRHRRSNQALFDEIQQIKAQQAADAAARRTRQRSAPNAAPRNAASAVAGRHRGAAPAELDAIQPENRALEEQILALEDAQARSKSARRPSRPPTALNQQKDAWHQLATTIGQEAERIHGEMIGRVRFAALREPRHPRGACARRRQDGRRADRPGASQQADTLAAGQAHSATELALLRASLAFGCSRPARSSTRLRHLEQRARGRPARHGEQHAARHEEVDDDAAATRARSSAHARHQSQHAQAVDRGVPALATGRPLLLTA